MNARLPFGTLAENAIARSGGMLCVGLDPDPKRIPRSCGEGADGIVRFLTAIVEATKDLVCAYKPNMAFFEALGDRGHSTLVRSLAAIPEEIPVILDAKRGDIGSTAEFYARAAFDEVGADAITVNPLLGTDSLAPFLARRDRGVFALCLTSNPGAAEFIVPTGLHRRIAEAARGWSEGNPSVGLVVGATWPDALAELRELCPNAWMLLPGVGEQGGALEASLTASRSPVGNRTIVNASRAILYASSESDFAEAARRSAAALRDRMVPHVHR